MKILRVLYYGAIYLPLIIIHPQSEQPDSIVIKEIGISELSEIINNRNGKGLLINIWATWCRPCEEEFPALVRLSDQYKDKIDVVGISIDYPDEVESKIYPFLNKYQVSFINYVNEEKDAEEFINFLNGEWSGAIPASFIYDSDGNQLEFMIGKKSFKEFEEAVLNYFN